MKFIVIGVLILIVLLILTEPIEAGKRNKRKNERYIGNAPNKDPHIHSGKGFDVYKEGPGWHRDLRDPKEVDYLLANKRKYDNAKDPDAITKKLQKMKKYNKGK